MSVSVLNDSVICAIATYARDNKLLPLGMSATDLARALSAANVATFNAQYHELVRPMRRYKVTVWANDRAICDDVSRLFYNIDWRHVGDIRVLSTLSAVLQRADESQRKSAHL